MSQDSRFLLQTLTSEQQAGIEKIMSLPGLTPDEVDAAIENYLDIDAFLKEINDIRESAEPWIPERPSSSNSPKPIIKLLTPCFIIKAWFNDLKPKHLKIIEAKHIKQLIPEDMVKISACNKPEILRNILEKAKQEKQLKMIFEMEYEGHSLMEYFDDPHMNSVYVEYKTAYESPSVLSARIDHPMNTGAGRRALAHLETNPKSLYNLVKNNEIEKVAKALEAFTKAGHGQGINLCDGNGYGVLDCAVAGGLIEMTKLLLQYGADCRQHDSQGRTPLIWAIQNNDFDIIHVLLEWAQAKNCLQEIMTQDTCMGSVCRLLSKGSLNSAIAEIVREYDQKKHLPCDTQSVAPWIKETRWFKEINSIMPKSDVVKDAKQTTVYKFSLSATPLHQAIMLDNDEVQLQKSISQNMQYLNAQDHLGLTPLHYAARQGHDIMIKLLLEAGADCNIKTIESQNACTPLHVAIWNHQVNACKVILEYAKLHGKLYEVLFAISGNYQIPAEVPLFSPWQDLKDLFIVYANDEDVLAKIDASGYSDEAFED